MDFIEIDFTCESSLSEILIAELSMEGYDIFQEHDLGFQTAIEKDKYEQVLVESIVKKYEALGKATYTFKEVEKINWNQQWEEHYEPVAVEDKVYVRATFHEPMEGYQHEIVIHPKMSFGTGHHATTYLMLNEQTKIDHSGKKVYDFGTGTGILAIMASKLGATEIIANDVDDWCIENAKENFGLNNTNAELFLGPVVSLNLTSPAEIVLANINKNILMEEMVEYERLLCVGGTLLLSGFYEQDLTEITKKGESLGLQYVSSNLKNGWSVLVLHKPA